MRPARLQRVSLIGGLIAPAIYSALSATSRAEPASAGLFFPAKARLDRLGVWLHIENVQAAVVSVVDTVWNTVEIALPSVVTAAMRTTVISVSRTAYSAADAPLSSWKNLRAKFFTGFAPVDADSRMAAASTKTASEPNRVIFIFTQKAFFK